MIREVVAAAVTLVFCNVSLLFLAKEFGSCGESYITAQAPRQKWLCHGMLKLGKYSKYKRILKLIPISFFKVLLRVHVLLCSPVSCFRWRPPTLTGQAHLQHLSNQVDCYKAAGMEADGASGPSRQIVLWSAVGCEPEAVCYSSYYYYYYYYSLKAPALVLTFVVG